jgi:hypothetical protein
LEAILAGAAAIAVFRRSEPMNRDNQQGEELMDLGTASVETRGAPGNKTEFGVIGLPLGLQAE